LPKHLHELVDRTRVLGARPGGSSSASWDGVAPTIENFKISDQVHQRAKPDRASPRLLADKSALPSTWDQPRAGNQVFGARSSSRLGKKKKKKKKEKKRLGGTGWGTHPDHLSTFHAGGVGKRLYIARRFICARARTVLIACPTAALQFDIDKPSCRYRAAPEAYRAHRGAVWSAAVNGIG